MVAKVLQPAILVLVFALCLTLVSAQTCTSVKGNIVPDRKGTPGPAALTGLNLGCSSQQHALRTFNLIRTDAAGNAAFKGYMRLVGTCCTHPGIRYGWVERESGIWGYVQPVKYTTEPFPTNVFGDIDPDFEDDTFFLDDDEYPDEYPITKILSVVGATVRCPEGKLLHSFEYVDGGEPGTLKVKYECLEHDGTSLGVTNIDNPRTSTGETRKGGVLVDMEYHSIYLDRQKVACGNDEWLTGFDGPTFGVNLPEAFGFTHWEKIVEEKFGGTLTYPAEVPPPTYWTYRYTCLKKPAAEAASIGVADNATAAAPAVAPAVAPAPSTSGAMATAAVATVGATVVALAALVLMVV